MVTKHGGPFNLLSIGSVLAKILMVTKQLLNSHFPYQSSVLAKILMVTKPYKLQLNNISCSVLAKILMVTKHTLS